MTKKKIATALSSDLHFIHKDSLNFTNSFIDIIKSNSKKCDIKIHEFGTFYMHSSPKRIGRNPKTKESYIIPPRIKVNFKPSKKIKEVLN